MPWWNPYSGVGLPLAGEYQPAAFFPLTFLLLLPRGPLLEHLLLQMLAGWGTYALLRQMGIGRWAALTAGILYGMNGTLAWFHDTPSMPVPFLPWMLFGIERARVHALTHRPGGWRWFAAALTFSLVAGFPETAYINCLFALAWCLYRLAEMPRAVRGAFAGHVTAGGVVAVALAAPQLVAFVTTLPVSFIGGHAGAFATAHLASAGLLPSLLAPYVYGPIFGYGDAWATVRTIWDNIGGYVDILLCTAAAYGAVVKRNGLVLLLMGWIVLALAKTFGVSPVVSLWNAIPGIPNAAFYRYAPPSWELAVVILCALGLDQLAVSRTVNHLALGVAALVPLGSGVTLLIWGRGVIRHLVVNAMLRDWARVSLVWAVFTVGSFFLIALLARARWRAKLLGILLMADAALLFGLPTLSNPAIGVVDVPAIHFLQHHLGHERFYTLGPIQPNYGAYFGIASINHNLPSASHSGDSRELWETPWDQPGSNRTDQGRPSASTTRWACGGPWPHGYQDRP